MCEWISQNTFTMPGRVNVFDRLVPDGYRPRLNDAPRDSEKTLWKNGSSFGKATADPVVTATTCGTNCSSFCAIEAGRGAGFAAGMSAKKMMTFLISGCGLGRGPTDRRSYALALDGAELAS